MSQFFSSLTDFDNPHDAIPWLSENRETLYKSLSSFYVGQGRSAYDDVLSRVESLFTAEGIDFLSAIDASETKDLKVDILPLKFKIYGEWNEDDLQSLDPKFRKVIEEKTIRQLALANFSNQLALKMLLDPKCSIVENKKLLEQVLTRRCFWDHSAELMGIIERAPSSPMRDDSLVRSIDLIADKDNIIARQWAELIHDAEKKAKVLNDLAR